MYINFQQIAFVDQSKHCTKIINKNGKLHKFATTNSNFEKRSISDMHYRITYIYINFEQNRVSRSMYTQIYMQKIASCINL